MYELCLSGRMPETQELLQKDDTIKIKRFVEPDHVYVHRNDTLAPSFALLRFAVVCTLSKETDYHPSRRTTLSMIGTIRC